MSKSITFILENGGAIHPNTHQLATLEVSIGLSHTISDILSGIATQSHHDWTFDDGSIITLWDAGCYAKLPWYFMAYDCEESDAIRYRRANPTPDTSNE